MKYIEFMENYYRIVIMKNKNTYRIIRYRILGF